MYLVRGRICTWNMTLEAKFVGRLSLSRHESICFQGVLLNRTSGPEREEGRGWGAVFLLFYSKML